MKNLFSYFRIKISIRHSLLIAFSGLVLHMIILALVSFDLLSKAGRAQAIQDHFMVLQTQSLQLLKMDADFLNFEMMDTLFFIHGKSTLTQRRDSLYKQLLKGISQAHNYIDSNNQPLKPPLAKVDSLLRCYTVTIERLTDKIRLRGFRDHGLEGTMRGYAHQLEQHSDLIAPEQLLTLRRHEKDFFLRRDTAYIVKFNALSGLLLENLKGPQPSQTSTIKLLELYQKTFNKVAQLEKQIGLTENMGLRKDLYDQGSSIERSFQGLATLSIAIAKQKISSYKVLFFFLFLSSIALAIGVSIFLANRLSLPLRNLTSFVDACISHGFHNKGPNIKTSSLEISKLTLSFKRLIRKINLQFDDINVKAIEMETQNKELLKINNELDLFVYSTAHDLRAPLASLLGLIQVFKMEADGKQYGHFFSMMEESISKQEKVIKDIVHYAENNTMELKNEPIDLEEVIGNILKDCRFSEGATKISKMVAIDRDWPFFSDKRRLFFILNNLLSNSIKYQDPNKVAPYLNISATVGKEKVILKVEDNGIGIESKYMDNIFKMFYRATTNSDGSGLGLYIVKESVQKLDGTIEAHSVFGRGSTFTICIPNKYNDLAQEASLSTNGLEFLG